MQYFEDFRTVKTTWIKIRWWNYTGRSKFVDENSWSLVLVSNAQHHSPNEMRLIPSHWTKGWPIKKWVWTSLHLKQAHGLLSVPVEALV